jgi:prepilin-type N-terminal cleavage/methylation domain-containing protein
MHVRKGFSLVEVMVATVVISAILLASMGLMNTMMTGATVEKRYVLLSQRANRALEQMRSDLWMADISTTLTTGTDSVTYQVPVEYDGDVVDVSSGFAPYWGYNILEAETTTYTSGASTLYDQRGNVAMFRFTAVRTYSETSEGFDLNEDNDTGDTFKIGRIEHVLFDGSDTTQTPVRVVPLTGNNIVQDGSIATADFDGQAGGDPMFVLATSAGGTRILEIKVVYADLVSEPPYLRTVSVQFELTKDL